MELECIYYMFISISSVDYLEIFTILTLGFHFGCIDYLDISILFKNCCETSWNDISVVKMQ